MKDHPTSDEFRELLERAKEGEELALGELIERFRPYLLLVANEDLDPRVVAKTAPSDVVQLSLLHAQRSLANFAGHTENEFRAWLRTILKHDLLKTRRGLLTKKRDLRRELPLQDDLGRDRSIADPTLTPSSEAAHSERMELLARAFAELSAEHQQVIKLRNFSGLSFPEIGEQMNRSSDASSKLWARAIDSLRRKLDKIAPELFADIFDNRSS